MCVFVGGGVYMQQQELAALKTGRTVWHVLGPIKGWQIWCL